MVLQNLLFIVTDVACLQPLHFITIAKAEHTSTMSDDAKSIGCATRTWRYFLVIVYFAVFKRDNEPLTKECIFSYHLSLREVCSQSDIPWNIL